MLSNIILALAGEEALKNHCAYCHGKFGMVRHRRAFRAFCSQKCVAHHKAWLRAEARTHKGWLETGLAGWLGWEDANSGIRDHSGSPFSELYFFVPRFARCKVPWGVATPAIPQG
jgi:endogenous inhibitor of DNA gyrase (YacG/DUF329 family)